MREDLKSEIKIRRLKNKENIEDKEERGGEQNDKHIDKRIILSTNSGARTLQIVKGTKGEPSSARPQPKTGRWPNCLPSVPLYFPFSSNRKPDADLETPLSAGSHLWTSQTTRFIAARLATVAILGNNSTSSGGKASKSCGVEHELVNY